MHYAHSLGQAVYEVGFSTAGFIAVNNLILLNAYRYNSADPTQIRATSDGVSSNTGIDIYLQNVGTDPTVTLVFEGLTGTPVAAPVVGATPYAIVRTLDLATASLAVTGPIQGGDQGLTLKAGGTDQNITLTPSGAGNTIFNGNVGIGTATPTTKLEVAGTSGVAVTIRTTTNAVNDTTQLNLGANSSVPQGGAILKSIRTSFNGANTDLAVLTTSSGTPNEALRVTSDGKLGVGTATPSTKLEVAGDVTVGSAASSDGSNLRLLSSAALQWNVDNFAGTLRFFTETGYGVGGVERMKLTGNDLWLAGTLTASGLIVNSLSVNGQAFGNPSDYLKTTGAGNLTVTSLTASGGTLAGSSTTGLTLSSGGAGKDLVLDPDGTGTGDVVIPKGNKLKMNDAAVTARFGEINIGTNTGGTPEIVSLVDFGDATHAGFLRGQVNGTTDSATLTFGYRYKTPAPGNVDTFVSGLSVATSATGATSLTGSLSGLTINAGAADQTIALLTAGTGFVSTVRSDGGNNLFSLATNSIQVRTSANASNGMYFFRDGAAGFSGATSYGIRFTDAVSSGSNGYFDWLMGGNSALRIFNGGNFGFGTTTDGGQKLQVNGTTSLGGNTTVTGTLQTSGAATLGGNTSVTGTILASSYLGAGTSGSYATELGGGSSSGYLRAYATAGGVIAPLRLSGSTLTFGTGTGNGTDALLINGSQQVSVTTTTEATTGGGGALTVAGGIFASKKIITATDLVAGAGLTVATAATFNGGATVSGGPLVANAGVNASALTSGTLTGGASGLALNGGGSGDQNITLTPTGAGNTIINGKVGIGTATPTTKLEVAGTSGVAVTIRTTTNAVNDTTQLNLGANPSIPQGGAILKSIRTSFNGSDTDLAVLTTSSGTPNEALRVTSDGKLGVGTATPTAKLEVTGTTKLDGAVTATGDVAITSGTLSTSSTTGALKVTGGVGLSENLNVGGAISVAGNVTSSSPTTGSLIVTGGAGVSGALNVGGAVAISGNATSTSYTTGALVVAGGAGVGGNANIHGNTTVDGTTRLSGNVGIGTAPTTNKLEVAGSTRITGDVTATGSASATSIIATSQVTAPTYSFPGSSAAVQGTTTGLVLSPASGKPVIANGAFSATGRVSAGADLVVAGKTGVGLGGEDPQATLHVRGHSADGEIARFEQGSNSPQPRSYARILNKDSSLWWELSVQNDTGTGNQNGFGLWAKGGSVDAIAKPRFYVSSPAAETADRSYARIYAQNPNFAWELSVEDSNGGGSGTSGFALRSRKLQSGSFVSTRLLYVTPTGEVGLGTSNPGAYKLAVNGTIRATEVVVEQENLPDFVFADDYRNAPLSEVEQHIKAHKHLPGVPSAADTAEKGLSVGKMQSVLLQKVEELTLHMIEQEKRIKRLEEENAALRVAR